MQGMRGRVYLGQSTGQLSRTTEGLCVSAGVWMPGCTICSTDYYNENVDIK